MPRRTLVFAALALAVVMASAACTKDEDDAAESQRTTTTADPRPSPLTGTDVAAARLDRPVLIVKVDNSPRARPQSGLNNADVVVEQRVEGGQTRFAAMFNSTDAYEVGPVRSGRSSDVNYFSSLSRPLFAYSGANSFFKVLVRKSVFFDVGFERAPDAYTRRGEHLFTSTSALYEKAPKVPSSPTSLWAFRDKDAPVGGDAAAGASIVFEGSGATKIEWRWNAGARVYHRTQNGTPHADSTGAPLTAANIVIQFSEYKDSGFKDSSQAAVPEIVAVGSGDLWVLTEGKLIKGRWTRPSVTKPVTFTDEIGKPIALTPGRSWIELPTAGSARAIT